MLLTLITAFAQHAQAFPPYRTTDADTADPYVRLGVGFIKKVGRGIEIRSGIYVGLSDEAPDVLLNLWLSTKVPFR